MARDASKLVDSISATLRKVSTQALDLSFNELLDMHESNELNIAPDYQRLFRWTEGQQSRFIESLILELPVPPIFVIEEGEGVYQLIDGLQRISSYLHLRGKLSAPHLDPPVQPPSVLTLTDCDIVTELNGLRYDDLPAALQIRLKRAFIRVEVVRKGTDPRFQYHMFKRLNTGGEQLSEQQIRNCTIRLLDSHFADFIIEMSNLEAFRECTSTLTQDRRLSAFDQELVLRFFAFKNRRSQFKHEVSDFLTEFMEDVAEGRERFDYRAESEIFTKTFTLLQRSLREYSFAFANKARDKLSAGFSVYHFEAITVGMQKVLDQLNPEDQTTVERLRRELEAVKFDARFVTITTGGGKNSPGPLNQRIGFIENRLTDALA